MIIIQSKWKKGDERQYKIYKSKIKIKDNVELSRKTSIKYLEIDVLKLKDDHYVLEWSEFKETTNRFRKFIEKILGFRLDDDINVKYKTNKYGSIEEILNKDFIKQYVEDVRNLVTEGKENKDAIKEIISEEVIVNKLLQKLNFFHLPYGMEFSEDSITEQYDFKNLIMDENDIPGEIKYNLIYFDKTKKIGEIEIEKKYFQIALNQNIDETVKNISEKLGNDKKQGKVPPFAVTERYWYKMDFNTGWIIKGKYEKGFLADGQDVIDELVFEIIK